MNPYGWISTKKKMPPLFQYVEVIYKEDQRIRSVNRDYACFIRNIGDDGYTKFYWARFDGDEESYGEYGVKWWRPIRPDHRGKVPYLTTDKRGYWKVKDKPVEDKEEDRCDCCKSRIQQIEALLVADPSGKFLSIIRGMMKGTDPTDSRSLAQFYGEVRLMMESWDKTYD